MRSYVFSKWILYTFRLYYQHDIVFLTYPNRTTKWIDTKILHKLSLSHACWLSWIQTFHFVMKSSFCKWIKLTGEFHIKTSNEKLRVQKAEEKARSEITCVSLAWCVQKDVQHTNKHQKKAKEVTTPNWYIKTSTSRVNQQQQKREREWREGILLDASCWYSFSSLKLADVRVYAFRCVCVLVLLTVISQEDGSQFFFDHFFPLYHHIH